jgi:hypothetical protein
VGADRGQSWNTKFSQNAQKSSPRCKKTAHHQVVAFFGKTNLLTGHPNTKGSSK